MKRARARRKAAKPRRLREFVLFFRGYMSLSALVTAALPIPVTAARLIPSYTVHTSVLSVYASLFCFLLLGYLFYSRDVLARWMFRDEGGRRQAVALLPLVLILLCVGSVVTYHGLLDTSVGQLQDLRSRQGRPAFTDVVLRETEWAEVPYGAGLLVSYVAIFLFAEAAFVLMALREYLMEVGGYREKSLRARVEAQHAAASSER